MARWSKTPRTAGHLRAPHAHAELTRRASSSSAASRSAREGRQAQHPLCPARRRSQRCARNTPRTTLTKASHSSSVSHLALIASRATGSRVGASRSTMSISRRCSFGVNGSCGRSTGERLDRFRIEAIGATGDIGAGPLRDSLARKRKSASGCHGLLGEHRGAA